jgi:hypothetical protein
MGFEVAKVLDYPVVFIFHIEDYPVLFFFFILTAEVEYWLI